LLFREFCKFCTCSLDPGNILCDNFLIFYFKINGENWIESQKHRLLDNSEAHGEFGCLLCKLGGGKAVYSTLTVTFPWKKKIKKTVSSHRFAYMLHTKNFDMSSDMQVSHRCHNRRCVNIDHLSYEPPNVNQDR
jgi:hypothetical protein